MRQQGQLTEWKDAQGFGFITPDGGGARVFVHIKSFADSRHRPTAGERLSYLPGRDAQGRPRAQQVDVLGGSRSSGAPRMRRSDGARAPASGWLAALVLVACVFGAMCMAAWAGHLAWALVAVYAAVSVLSFVVYALDKSAAISGRWRTPESHLHLLALAGGWPGALLAQRLLRHKSSKTSFQVVFWATVVLNGCLLAWLTGWLAPAHGEGLRQLLRSMG